MSVQYSRQYYITIEFSKVQKITFLFSTIQNITVFSKVQKITFLLQYSTENKITFNQILYRKLHFCTFH